MSHSTKSAAWVTLLVIAGAASPAGAGEVSVVLRSQAMPKSPIVRLGDIADVRGSTAGVASLIDAPLTPSPARGTTLYMHLADVRELLAAAGTPLRDVRFSGAVMVAITRADDSADAGGELTAAARDETTRSAAEAIVRHLEAETGVSGWQAGLTRDDAAVVQLAKHSDWQVSGGKPPWTGPQQFKFSSAGAPEPLVVSARVERSQAVVYATRDIKAGDFVGAADVDVRTHVGSLPPRAATSLESVVGQEAVQAIRADSMMMTSQVRSPILVRRGERVVVKARAAGIVVRTYATAREDGAMGDLVAVEPLESRERYAARVAGLRELEVMAIGQAAGELAAARR